MLIDGHLVLPRPIFEEPRFSATCVLAASEVERLLQLLLAVLLATCLRLVHFESGVKLVQVHAVEVYSRSE